MGHRYYYYILLHFICNIGLFYIWLIVIIHINIIIHIMINMIDRINMINIINYYYYYYSNYYYYSHYYYYYYYSRCSFNQYVAVCYVYWQGVYEADHTDTFHWNVYIHCQLFVKDSFTHIVIATAFNLDR